MLQRSRVRFHRQRGWPPLALGLVGFGLGLFAIALLSAPRVLAFRPSPTAATSTVAPVEIVFSSPMDQTSVAARLQVHPDAAGAVRWVGNTLQYVPSRPWPADADVQVTLRWGARARTGLFTLRSYTWAFRPAGLRVVYVAQAGDSSELVVLPLGGGPAKVLAQSPLPIQGYDVSPTATFIIYAVGPSDAAGDLWYLALDGSAPRLLVGCGGDQCREPHISPDGRWVAYERAVLGPSVTGIVSAQRPRVWVLDLSTQEAKPVGEEGHATRAPQWGRQGWLAYYDADLATIVVDDLKGGRTFVPNDSGDIGTWTPDGASLIFPEIRFTDVLPSTTPIPAGAPAPHPQETEGSQQYSSHLMRATIATNQMVDLSSSALVEDTSPVVSPDGKRLAFARKYLDPQNWTPGRQLWVMDIDGNRPQQLTSAGEFNVSALQWSLDGREILYMRFSETRLSQPAEIWAIDADGQNPRQLIVGAHLPRWLP